jgi:hypothetical protein
LVTAIRLATSLFLLAAALLTWCCGGEASSDPIVVLDLKDICDRKVETSPRSLVRVSGLFTADYHSSTLVPLSGGFLFEGPLRKNSCALVLEFEEDGEFSVGEFIRAQANHKSCIGDRGLREDHHCKVNLVGRLDTVWSVQSEGGFFGRDISGGFGHLNYAIGRIKVISFAFESE